MGDFSSGAIGRGCAAAAFSEFPETRSFFNADIGTSCGSSDCTICRPRPVECRRLCRLIARARLGSCALSPCEHTTELSFLSPNVLQKNRVAEWEKRSLKTATAHRFSCSIEQARSY